MGKAESVGPRVAVDPQVKAVARKPKWTAADAEVVIGAWRRSGAKLAEFGRAYGVGDQRIRNWRDRAEKQRRRAAAAEVAPRLVPVTVREPSAAVGGGDGPDRLGTMEIMVAGGRSVRVGADFDAAAVARLVAALEQLGC